MDTVGGNANKYSHYGEQGGDSLKNWKQTCLIGSEGFCTSHKISKNIPIDYEKLYTHNVMPITTTEKTI